MRAHFSIEWMAQSSQQQQHQAAEDSDLVPANNKAFTAAGLKASGTHPASLPGSYCRQEEESRHEEEAGSQSNVIRHPASNRLTSSLQHQNLHLHLHSEQMAEAGFSSGTEEEETSGYESEGGRSLSPASSAFNNTDLSPSSSSSSSSPGGSSSPPLGGRRPRTAFTAEQISSLERAFKRNAYLGTQDKAELCSKLSLSDKQVRNWFQNRRMKLKRTVQDALAHACQANMASQLLHFAPELQAGAYRPGPYTPRYHHHDGSGVPSAAPYLHCLPYGSQTLDPLYHYAGLPGVLLSSGTAAQLMGSYQQY